MTTGSAGPAFRYGHEWWRRGVVYQVYPRSFADSDGDGTGDLRGLIEHLPYLGPDGLGVDAVWLSPIYPSPGRDIGYDVSDHGAIDPRFGSEADFDRFVAEAHRLGIRVILDLVMNHTSDEHPWFVASRASREGPYADWYIWRDPSGVDRHGRPLPPNNWVSWFGGPAWTYDPGRGQFYHHTFLPEQPELDWRVPDVEAAQFEMVRRWTERGVDGYRLDTFNVFLKDPAMPSNPHRRGASAWTRQEHRFELDQPDLPDLIGRFRAMVDAAPGRMSVGELFVGTTESAAALTTDRHLVFDWELLTRPWSAEAFRTAIRRRERAFGPARWPTVVLSNHDQPRHASRLSGPLGATAEIQDAVARAAALILLTVRGTPFLYYGEELGLGDVPISPEESIDAPAARTGPDFLWWDRSAARTPMPWAPGPGVGFTTGTPWLRLGSDAQARNVESESHEPGSVLETYRRILAARRSTRALQDGAISLTRTGDPTVLGYRRQGAGGEAMVLVSFGPGDGIARVPRPARGVRWRPLVGTHLDPPETLRAGSTVRLRPYEGIVAVAEDRRAGRDRLTARAAVRSAGHDLPGWAPRRSTGTQRLLRILASTHGPRRSTRAASSMAPHRRASGDLGWPRPRPTTSSAASGCRLASRPSPRRRPGPGRPRLPVGTRADPPERRVRGSSDPSRTGRRALDRSAASRRHSAPNPQSRAPPWPS